METFYVLPEEYYDSYYPIVLETSAAYVATNDVEHYWVSPDRTVAITLSGPYQQVMSIKRSLDAAPPSLTSYPASIPMGTAPMGTAPMGTTSPSQRIESIYGNDKRVTDGGVTYSGSGIMIFCASTTSPNDWHFVLLCENTQQQANIECGSCDGNFKNNQNINDNFLFEHAQKQCLEKSIGLFNIIESPTNRAVYVDIILPDQTIYRVYCYWILMNNINLLPGLFHHNNVITAAHHQMYGAPYRATSELSLFKIDRLASILSTQSSALYNVQSFPLQNTVGQNHNIHIRTRLVLHTLINQNLLTPHQPKNVTSKQLGNSTHVIEVPT